MKSSSAKNQNPASASAGCHSFTKPQMASMTRRARKMVIIGGGIAGLCRAVYARKCGYEGGLIPVETSFEGVSALRQLVVNPLHHLAHRGSRRVDTCHRHPPHRQLARKHGRLVI